MGHQEEHVYHSTLNYGHNEGLTLEMQERCREVASELRFIADSLERSYCRRSGINWRVKMIVGAILLGIATNVVLRYFTRFLFP